MIPDDLRQRLAAQRTAKLRAAGAGYVETAGLAAIGAIVRSGAGRLTCSEILPGAVEIATVHGPHLALRIPLADWRSAGLGALSIGRVPLKAAAPRPARMAARLELSLWRHADAEQAIFLDLETCGFAGAPIFLVGLLHHDGGAWVVEQLLARNYAEERAILATLWQRLTGKQILATFNGKSFDWPMVRDRSVFHRLISPASRAADHEDAPGPAAHLDVLHHARRQWGATLANCKLQTLERHICGRVRRGDLPGREAPAAYHRFVRDGDPRQLRAIVHHNAWDLVTLWELAAALAERQEPPTGAAQPPDVLPSMALPNDERRSRVA